jgi:hypothetical protein
MQVPEGEKLAGLVHHKIHDAKWTQLSLGPHEDPMPRFLQPPSTAATLNLAANAAQCARIWKKIDKAFADKCLKAAERAWAAANANPRIYARSTATAAGRTTTTTSTTSSTGRRRSSTSRREGRVQGRRHEVQFFKSVDADWKDDKGNHLACTRR